MTKQSLFQLLADNQIDTLFHELKGSNSKYINDLVLLESQWSDLRARERNGTITSEQSNVEVARIRKNLLELIERSFGTPTDTPLPRFKPSTPAFHKWGLVAAVVGILATVILVTIVLSNGDLQAAEKTLPSSKSVTLVEDAGKKSDGKASRQSGKPKMLEVPANSMTFKKGRIGDITYKFLSAELSEQNMDTWLLRLKVRGIKPAHGFLISSNQLHISYGDFEKGPVNNSFSYINPGETADGVVEFEIPKEYKEAKLLIYDYPDEPPLGSIPFKW